MQRDRVRADPGEQFLWGFIPQRQVLCPPQLAAGVEARLDAFVEEEQRVAIRDRGSVASQKFPTRSERNGVRPGFRLVTSSEPMPPTKPTGCGR